MNTGGKYDSRAFKKSVGLNGVGTKAVNALSSSFKVESCRDGKVKSVFFEKGNLTFDNDIEESSKRKGTKVTFIPDDLIFKKYNTSLEINFNKSLIAFNKHYPLTDLNIFFSAKVDPITENNLIKSLYPLLKDKNELEAVNILLDFVENSFENVQSYNHFSLTHDAISPVELVFGTDESPIRIINDITGVDLTSDAIKKWQQGNIDLLAEHGISMTSNKEECVAYFKDYWNLNNISCVTEL